MCLWLSAGASDSTRKPGVTSRVRRMSQRYGKSFPAAGHIVSPSFLEFACMHVVEHMLL